MADRSSDGCSESDSDMAALDSIIGQLWVSCAAVQKYVETILKSNRDLETICISSQKDPAERVLEYMNTLLNELRDDNEEKVRRTISR